MRLSSMKHLSGERQFVLTITDRELAQAELSMVDRDLIAQADRPDASISEKLLALEAIAHAVEQAALVDLDLSVPSR